MKEKVYTSIDLKSFYASVECVERGLDPLTTNLLVADRDRTEKTICLAVSPSLKSHGIPGRPRLFEVVEKVREINVLRLGRAPGRVFTGSSYDDIQLRSCPGLGLDYITATPRMAYYIEYSARIYKIYLKYISPEDIHVYSVDEVFIDIGKYLKTYQLSAKDLVNKILLDILDTTGITATAGIGTNLYLAKVAMDILAKKMPITSREGQIAELDEMTYRKLLWGHKPITDFWRVGKGYGKRLEKQGLFTMGDIARCSLGGPNDYYNEDLLYKMFGINAELLIDHAWGWEPCTIEDIKAYRAKTKSLGSSQVLPFPYSFNKARLIVWEMVDLLVLDLVSKGLLANQIVLRITYDRESLLDPYSKKTYRGEIVMDSYGRARPKSSRGTINLGKYTSSTKVIIDRVMDAFENIVDKDLLIRRLSISANNILEAKDIKEEVKVQQLDFFTDYGEIEKKKLEEEAWMVKERLVQETIVKLRNKYGRNAVLKGINLEEGARTIVRNKEIGGHKA